MSYSRCASLVFALAVSACASSGGTSPGEAGQTARDFVEILSTLGGTSSAEAGQTAARGNSSLIVRAELEEIGGRSLWDAVLILRGRWLQPQRNSSFAAGPAYARVVVDEITRRELDELQRWSADEIEYMRYLTGPDATIKYGGGFPGGVIEVITRSGR